MATIVTRTRLSITLYVHRLCSLPYHGQTDCEVNRDSSTADIGTLQGVKLSGHEINHLFPSKCRGTVRGDYVPFYASFTCWLDSETRFPPTERKAKTCKYRQI